MMAVINVSAVFEYGCPGRVVRGVGGKESGSVGAEAAAMKVMMAKGMMSSGGGEDEKMDVDERPQVQQTKGTNRISPAASEAEDTHVPCEEVVEHPPAFKYALRHPRGRLRHMHTQA